MAHRIFGHMPDGTPVLEYALKSERITVSVLTFGGILRTLTVNGRDVIGGYDSFSDYLIDDDPYRGAIIGRVCNRIGGAKFSMNGKTYHLSQNDGRNHLHGGENGFHRRVFSVVEADDEHIVLSRLSPDGEEGYPATLSVRVRYTVKDDCLIIAYDALSDGDTPVNLTNHAFFNLNGIGSGDILGHTVMIRGDRYTEVDAELIPTGRRPSVAGTPFDFRDPHTIGERYAEINGGYDHNFLFADAPKKEICGMTLPHVATISTDGLAMEVYTDAEGAQLYMGGFLHGPLLFKGGIPKERFHAFCFETQGEPDGIHHGTPPLRAGEPFRSVTVYRFI